MVSPTCTPSASPNRDLTTGLLDGRLAVGHVADVDVEQVDLAVDGPPLAARAEHDRGVRELVLATDDLGHAAGDQEDRVLAPTGRGRERGAVEWLGGGTKCIGRAKDRPLLGEDDELGAVGLASRTSLPAASRLRSYSSVELVVAAAARIFPGARPGLARASEFG